MSNCTSTHTSTHTSFQTQSSTAGYYGVYAFESVTTLIKSSGTGFPTAIPASYTALVGEKDVTGQVRLQYYNNTTAY
jgi:hypothetical protein